MVNGKKKVLFFLNGSVGGAESMTLTVAKILPREQYDVAFIIIGRNRTIEGFLSNDYVAKRIRARNKYCFLTARILLKIIQENPSLVYCSLATYNPRVIIASKIANVPVIIRSSGMPSTYRKHIFRSVKATYRYADFIIAQQEDMRQELLSLLKVKASKCIALHNPLDIARIEGNIRSVQNPYPDTIQTNFCNVGRINKDKSQDIAILAFAQVRKYIPNAHLYFIGRYNDTGEYMQKLRNLVLTLKLSECVHFEGFDTNPHRWMKYCDCFIFPSRREGLPNALLEASYLEKPCVAACCLKIIRDIIHEGNNGYTVPVEDADSLAYAMIKALRLRNCKMVYQPARPRDFIDLFERFAK